MSYLRLAIAILLAAFAQSTYADSITTFHITQATMVMGPNDGSGDNVGFTFSGPGITISGTAGMGCIGSLWCTGQPVPDESAFPSEIFISGFPDVTIGGAIVFADFGDFFDSNGGLNPTVSGFLEGGIPVLLTLPTDGSWQFNFADTTDQFESCFLFHGRHVVCQRNTANPRTRHDRTDADRLTRYWGNTQENENLPPLT